MMSHRVNDRVAGTIFGGGPGTIIAIVHPAPHRENVQKTWITVMHDTGDEADYLGRELLNHLSSKK